MKTKLVKKEDVRLTSLEKMTDQEILDSIRKAEQGPFYTLEELKAKMLVWKKENGYL